MAVAPRSRSSGSRTWRAGLDLNTHHAALLSEIIAGETNRFPNQPTGANYLEPLVSALLQEGVDPTLVEADLTPTRSLASQVLRARMEQLTSVAPGFHKGPSDCSCTFLDCAIH